MVEENTELTLSYKDIKDTSACGTILTEYPLNSGGRSCTSGATKKDLHKTW